MKWPWQKAAENRGTVTFMADGRILVGLPHGEITDEARDRIIRSLREWSERGKQAERLDLAVFPFPIDVTDFRR